MTSLYNFSFLLDQDGAEPLTCNGIVAGVDYSDAVANLTGTFGSEKNKISKLLVEEVGTPAVLIGNPKPTNAATATGDSDK